MAVNPSNTRQAGGSRKLISTVDADNKFVESVDGTTATYTGTSPDGTKTIQLFAADAGAGVKINGTQVLAAQGANIVALTDNSGGAANDTIAAITNAANAGSADVGPTADAIADLAAKVNTIIAALKTAKIIASA